MNHEEAPNKIELRLNQRKASKIKENDFGCELSFRRDSEKNFAFAKKRRKQVLIKHINRYWGIDY